MINRFGLGEVKFVLYARGQYDAVELGRESVSMRAERYPGGGHTDLGVSGDDVVNKPLQLMVGLFDVDTSRLDPVALLCKLVETLLATSRDDHGWLRLEVVNGKSKGTTQASGGTDDEDTFSILDSNHGVKAVGQRAVRKDQMSAG